MNFAMCSKGIENRDVELVESSKAEVFQIDATLAELERYF
jgi:hypothetical protein